MEKNQDLSKMIAELKDARDSDLKLQTEMGVYLRRIERTGSSAASGLHSGKLGRRGVVHGSDELAGAPTNSTSQGNSTASEHGGSNSSSPTVGISGEEQQQHQTAVLASDELTPRWNAASRNGQDWPPYDTVFKNPPHSYAIACGVGAGASVIAIAASIVLINRIKSGPTSSRRALFMRIVALVPIVALTASLSTAFASVAVGFELIRHCYLGLAVFWLLELGFDLLGGFEAACGSLALSRPASVALLEDSDPSHSDMPTSSLGRRGSPRAVYASRRLLVWVWRLSTQYVYVNSLLAALLALLSLVSIAQHIPPLVDYVAVIAMQSVQLASALLAVAALSVFFTSTRAVLLVLKYHATGKASLVCVAVLINALQPLVLRVMSLTGALTDTPMFATDARATMWNNFLLSLEAPLLALWAFWCFPLAELYDPDVRDALPGVGDDAEFIDEARRLLDSSGSRG